MLGFLVPPSTRALETGKSIDGPEDGDASSSRLRLGEDAINVLGNVTRLLTGFEQAADNEGADVEQRKHFSYVHGLCT